MKICKPSSGELEPEAFPKKIPGYFYFSNLKFKKTRQAYGVITLPLREGKIFWKKILGGVKEKGTRLFLTLDVFKNLWKREMGSFIDQY